MVSIDFYLNETTRHAHLILPPTFALERSHYDLVFHALAVRNTVHYSPPLFAKPAGALHDWEILLELATRDRSGAGAAPRRRPQAAPAAGPRPDGLLALLLRLGPYGTLLPFGAGLTCGRVAKAVTASTSGPCDPPFPSASARRAGASTWRRPARGRPRAASSTRLPRARRGERPAPHRPPRPAQQQLVDAQHRAAREGPRPLHPAHAPRRRAAGRPRATAHAVRVTSRVGSVVAPLELTEACGPGW